MLAVVLSGGGAKGAYEAGVWKALRKLHIKYQIVTGTSIGALNGMMMTQNEFYRCIRLWKNINYDVLYDDFKKITSSKEMYLEYLNKIFDGGIDTNKIEQIINEHYKPNKLYNSKIGFGVVSFNLSTRKVVYSTKKNTRPDKLKKYILASATCFPFFKPTKIGTDVLVDGGYYDNLPINQAIDLGAEKIIAVDLNEVGIVKKPRKKVDIIYIKPHNYFGSFLVFDADLAKRGIRLGYNDTMKTYGKLDGNKFTFKKYNLIKNYNRYIDNYERTLKNIFKTTDSKLLNKIFETETFKGILPILGLLLLIFGLIMLQPDFGTGTIIVMSIVGLLFIGGVDFKYFIRLGIIGVIGVVGLILAAPYRLSRILSFLNPWSDPLGSGFQIIQSLYAIGPGGLFGFGIGNSRQKHFFLPEPQTDFIFSIISEELGFLGCLIIITLFVIICYNGFKIARNCNDLFGKYLSFGIIFQIAFQACLNLMVVVGLIPVTGVTLPFLSYGGSSLLITLCSIGIVLNISRKL